MNIPFSKVSIGIEEEEAVQRVLRSGWLAAGKEVEAFEQEFSDYISPKVEYIAVDELCTKTDVVLECKKSKPYYCIFTNSCTSALKIAYKWYAENSEGYNNVLTIPRNTFCATYSAADEIFGYSEHCSWQYYDDKSFGDEDRVNVHYASIKDKTPCLIEDSAHRIEPNDQLVGKIRCYSFYATKNMTTGSGGMFVTNDKEIYDFARLCWRDGISTSTYDRLHGGFGYEVKTMAGGYDGNDLAAAIGRVQLRKLPDFSKRRNEIRERYNSSFGREWAGNHLYCYDCGSEEEVKRMFFYLKENGVASGYHYPGTGWTSISLPIFPDLTDEEQDYIINLVKNFK
jgi:perosamine synthetase